MPITWIMWNIIAIMGGTEAAPTGPAVGGYKGLGEAGALRSVASRYGYKGEVT